MGQIVKTWINHWSLATLYFSKIISKNKVIEEILGINNKIQIIYRKFNKNLK